MDERPVAAAAAAVAPNPALADARQSLGPAKLDDLFPEGDAFRRSLQTFSVLLVLAAFIASFGLYQDSVAYLRPRFASSCGRPVSAGRTSTGPTTACSAA